VQSKRVETVTAESIMVGVDAAHTAGTRVSFNGERVFDCIITSDNFR
jgi:hypothetical protein